ncbi:hypothetical protein ACJBU6_09314 [Exserohilum turcicum]
MEGCSKHASMDTIQENKTESLPLGEKIPLETPGPSYPATTTYYGACKYISNIQPMHNNNGAAIEHVHQYRLGKLSPIRRAPPCPSEQEGKPAEAIPGYVTEAVHSFALDQVKELQLELSAAKAEIEVIQKSYRDLAAWTYNERVRLMGALAALRGVQQANTEKGEVAFHEVEKDTENEQCLSLNAQIDELIEEEKCRLSRS